MVDSISAINTQMSTGSTSTSRLWQDRLAEAQAKARAVDDRHTVAEDKLQVHQDWQRTPQVPRVTESGSVDMYM